MPIVIPSPPPGQAAARARPAGATPPSLLGLLRSGNLASLLPLLGAGALGTFSLSDPALAQVRGLEKLLAALSAGGVTAGRVVGEGVSHPERYAVEFLSKLISGGAPVVGRVMAPSLQRFPEFGHRLLMNLGIPPGGGVGRMVAGSAEELLGLLRTLLSMPRGTP